MDSTLKAIFDAVSQHPYGMLVYKTLSIIPSKSNRSLVLVPLMKV